MKGFVKRVSQKISKLSDEQVEQLIDAINEENDTLDSILESLSDGLVIVDEEWHLLQTNKAAERYLPFNVRPLEQRSENVPVWSLIEDPLISAFLQDCAANQKVNVSEEFSLAAPEDKVRFITVTVLPLVQKQKKEDSDAFETHVVGSIITIDDITEKRTQEVLLHRMESLASLTNLAASVAHEIKNPLGAISIHIQLLQKAVKKARESDGMLPDEKFMENYLAVINEEIDNLNKIVIDFLFAVRPVQAQMTLADPNALITKFANFFKAEFDSKKVEIPKVPLGFWMEDWFGWTRNNYDKIGHLMQGFGPAIYVRELLVRTSPLKQGKWLAFLSVAVSLGFSALDEIIEWAASLSNPTDTEAFLGTQGYIWDTQTDMFCCLIGSIHALLLLSKLHDKGLSEVRKR